MCLYFVIIIHVLVALLLFRGNAFWLTEVQAYWGVAILWSFRKPFGHTAFIWEKEIVLDSSFSELSLIFYSFTSKAVPLPAMGEAQWRPREGQPVQQCAAYSALVRLKPLSQASWGTLFLIITVAAEEWPLSLINLILTQFGLKHCFYSIERQRVTGRILFAIGHRSVFGPRAC